MKQRIIKFIKSEFVLCIAAVCAVISMFFVLPSAAYLAYIDVRTLCLLFCLMSLVAGFGKCSLFRLLAQTLLSRQKTVRSLTVVLILLPFFCSMFITNDVSLITFVPFAILVLSLCGQMKKAPALIVLQTVSANLGSMAMPFGNPQNLFLYANYRLSAAEFWGTVSPLAAVSLVCLLATFVCFFVFAGNTGSIPAVNRALSAIMEKNALLTAILASQFISNVPAAVLLSGFTDNWRALLAGTNIGGLGTPIASMASLISLKLYLKSDAARPGYYLMLFTVCNVIGLVLLTGFYLFIS